MSFPSSSLLTRNPGALKNSRGLWRRGNEAGELGALGFAVVLGPLQDAGHGDKPLSLYIFVLFPTSVREASQQHVPAHKPASSQSRQWNLRMVEQSGARTRAEEGGDGRGRQMGCRGSGGSKEGCETEWEAENESRASYPGMRVSHAENALPLRATLSNTLNQEKKRGVYAALDGEGERARWTRCVPGDGAPLLGTGVNHLSLHFIPMISVKKSSQASYLWIDPAAGKGQL